MSIASRGRGVRFGARIAALFLAGAMVLVTQAASSQASAPERTSFLIDRLKSEDARVRTQAALALGGTNDERAVQPLCGALDDGTDLVRQAVAAALKRLNRSSSSPCLKARLTIEKSDPVRLQITRALETIEGGASGGSESEPSTDDTPKVTENAKFYVAISNVANNTGRPQAEIEKLVGAAVRGKLDTLGGFQLAPMKESADTARAVMTKRKLKGFFLSVSVDAFDYSDGNLRVRVKVAVFTYPGKALRGEVPAGVTQTGVRPGDRSSEDQLLAMAAGRAAELFTQNFQ